MTTTCEKCGHEISLGEFPFCPHGFGIGTAIHDEIPGGIWLENYGPDPIKVYSHSERRRIMNTPRRDELTGQEYVLTERETFAPAPGTSRDPQGIPNPAGYRSLAAADIIARNGRSGQTVEEALADPDDIPNEPNCPMPEGVRPFNTTSDDPDTRALIRIIADARVER